MNINMMMVGKAEVPVIHENVQLQKNFTITRGSIEMLCLHKILESERPDIDEKRNDLLKLQGEFAVQLRELELVSQKYANLAHACSLVYLTLLHLDEVHFLYHYSVDFIIDIFDDVLKNSQLNGVTDHEKRLNIITNTFFQIVYRRVSQGMLHTDKALLALLLLRIYLKCHTNDTTYEAKFDHLLLRSELFMSDASKTLYENARRNPIPSLTDDQVVSLMQLSRLPELKEIVKKIQGVSDLASWMNSDNPEQKVPEVATYEGNPSPTSRALNDLLVIHALRPDRLVAAAHLVISATFGLEFMQQDKVTNLHEIIECEVTSRTPLLLCSATGFDASGKIEDLAVELNREVTSIDVGSSEGFQQAEKALESSSKSGRWVLLKNVHIAHFISPSWLTQIEKRLHIIGPHPQFRLIFTAEIHAKLPISVIQASRVVVFEPATGLKENMLRSLSSIPSNRITKAPVERARLYFLVCWFHALVQERLRYCPLGWAHSYEFSDADLRLACDTLDETVDSVAMGRNNVPPDELPWKALRTHFSQSIYGGKIDNKFDQTLLDCFLQKLFTSKAFDEDFVLINNVDGKSTPLCIPEAHSRDQLLQWISQIKFLQMPSWIGLPNNAEKILLTVRGQELIRNMLKMSDAELAYNDSSEIEQKAPSWMIVLAETANLWLSALPKNVTKLKRTKDNINDPLFQFFEREINLGLKLLSDVRNDLTDILSVCRGETKQNNHILSLTSSLNKGLVPSTWNRYTIPQSVTATEWMNDFVERVNQLVRLSNSHSLRNEQIWLGGMFSPKAYILATREMIAQTNGWPFEQLHMHIRVGPSDQADEFTINGLRVIGAECRQSNKIHLIDEVQSDVQLLNLSWTLEPSPTEAVSLPVYLYTNRTNLLFTFDFIPGNFEKSLLYERGVALVCNSFLS